MRNKPFLILFFCVVSCLKLYGFSPKELKLIQHAARSIELAADQSSKLSQEALQVHGYSSWMVRHLMNNLCSLPGNSYLEVGCWKGSTFVGALYGNESSVAHAYAVENWSEFGGPHDLFLENVARFIPRAPVMLCETDCFQLDKARAFSAPITIYLYDGAHDENSQARAFTYYEDSFDDVFIAVVDDWNWSDVRSGTQRGIREAGLEVLFEKELFTASNGDMNSWWNGIYVAVLKKRAR